MQDTPEPRKSHVRASALIWIAVNIGLPAGILLYGVTGSPKSNAEMMTILAYVVMLVANLPLSWFLSRRRVWLCILIYLGSNLLGFALNFIGCIQFFMRNA